MNILIAGDYCPKNRTKKILEDKQYEIVFSEVTKLTEKVDYSILNFECPVVINSAKPIKKNGPNLRCKKTAVEAIKYAGFNCVTLANNHFYDYGETGVKDTLNSLNEYKLDFVGGGLNIEHAQNALYKIIKEKKFAFINFCENEWSIATQTTGGSAPINPIKNYYQINNARLKADYVIVIVHGGTEHYQLPTPRMKETYRFYVDAGADVVINHHQHCYSGYEIYNEKPIFYGIGNFCFDWEGIRNNIWNKGYLVELNFKEKNITFKLHPYIQCDEHPSVTFMDKKNTLKFEEDINNLNDIISNETSLNFHFNQLIKKKQSSTLMMFEPYKNRYLTGLRYRGLIPSLFPNKKFSQLKNHIICEAHRDILISILNNK